MEQLLPREGDISLDASRSTSERNPMIDDNKFTQPTDEVLQKPNTQLDDNEGEEVMDKTTVSLVELKKI